MCRAVAIAYFVHEDKNLPCFFCPRGQAKKKDFCPPQKVLVTQGMNEDVASLPDELQAAVRTLSCKHGPLSVVKHSGQMKEFLAKNDTSFKQMYFSKNKAFVKRGKRGKPLQDHMEEDMRRMVGNFRALKSSHPTFVKGLYDKWRTLKDLQEDLRVMNDMYESLLKQPSSVFLICRDELSTLDDVERESFKAFADAYIV